MSITTSLLTAGVNSHQETSENFNALATDFVTAGVTGSIALSNGVTTGTGSYAVNAQGSPNMTVAVSAGTAWLFATPSGQNSQGLRVKNSASANVTISANSSGSTKYDFVYIAVDATKAAAPAVNADDVATLTTSRSSSSTTDNGTPPTYGYCIAVVTVANGASSITQANISDRRGNAVLSSAGVAQSTSWNNLGLAPNTITALGNRSYQATFNNTDVTGTIGPAARLKGTRTVACPTQSASLNGSTQYYSKTSPAGMTFTNNFVVSAWIKVTSYATSSIASRYNGTSGWGFQLASTGQVQLIGFNAGGANNLISQSYQSVPLNKWVHVAAQLDMTVTTTGTTNNYIMIDGVEVPNTATRGGTNPTALVQAGNLEIGSQNGGTQFFPGKIAQVAIYSAKVTQATILASMHQTLAGTETSLISAYSLSNSINDLNGTSANNLTANGSATTTAADAPFGVQADGTVSATTVHGIVQSATFSTNSTVIFQVPEGQTWPTSGGISAVSYSQVKAPYGMPVQRGKWTIEVQYRGGVSLGNTSNVWFGGATSGSPVTVLNVPVGEWQGTYGTSHYTDIAAGGLRDHYVTLSTLTTGESDINWTTRHLVSSLNANALFQSEHSKTRPISTTVATNYYLLAKELATINNHSFGNAGSTVPIISAENAYL